MLATLRIRNFVLIDQLELHLGPSLNVVTGETGAGKSILVNALGLLLGGRASPELVRPGANEAEVEALFSFSPGDPVTEQLRALGVAVAGDELVIRRVVAQGGRSRAYISGRLATVAELAQAGPLLMDIASQHESVSLTDPSTHLGFLDAFAKLHSERAAVARAVDELRTLLAETRAIAERARGKAEREAFVRFQLAAIDEVAPKSGEDTTLATERARLRHAGKLHDTAQRSVQALENGEGAVVDVLSRVAQDVRNAAAIDPALGPVADALEAARVEAAEASRTLERYAEGVDADPSRLDAIESRLFALEKLKRAHGPVLEDVVASAEKLRAELAGLGNAEGRLGQLEIEYRAKLARVGEGAQALSEKRRRAAERMATAITKELAGLGMGAAKIVVEVEDLARAGGDREFELVIGSTRLTRDGIDRVEFLIAPNKGVEPRPLRRVASGGELSRALLALKRVLADMAPAGSYVFDEVDTGVGGAVAERIARALADVARHRQVICITHLAPIAAFGASHFVVEKGHAGDVSRTSIVEVKAKARVQELARMISGATVTEAARKAALELLRAASSEVSTTVEQGPRV